MPDPAINLAAPTGVWRPVYAHRTALHATADTLVLAAWQADTKGLSLTPAVHAWRATASPASTPGERRQAAATAVLSTLATQPWDRSRAALALAAKRAHRTGWHAGHALATRDRADPSPYEDEGGTGTPLGPADLGDSLADLTAASVLASAIAATSRRAGRAIADSTGDPAADGEAEVDDGYDISLAADVAVSAAYGAGLIAAFMGFGVQSLDWVTAGDGRVCEQCALAEANSPYSPFGVPSLPAHPRCRCILAPS